MRGFLGVSLGGQVLLAFAWSQSDLKMIPERAELCLGERAIAPLRVEEVRAPSFPAGDLRIAFDGLVLTARSAGAAEPAWTASFTPGDAKRILAVGQRALYLCETREPKELIRVALADGAVERSELAKLSSDLEDDENEVPTEMLEFEDQPVLLSAVVEAGDRWGEKPRAWRVTDSPVTWARWFRGFLIGGPIVVSPERVVLAVARAPASEWAGYLAETRVFEVDGNLEPLAVTIIPRPPIGSLAKVQGSAVVWACDGPSLVRLQTSTEVPRTEFGTPGGYDGLVDLRWFRHIAPTTSGWLRMDPAWPWPVFGDDEVLVAGGGWVARTNDRVFRFPIVRVELASGSEQQLELRVPFEGRLGPPESNYRSTGDEYEVLGWYGIGLGALELSSEGLACILTNERLGARLEFDWKALLGAPESPR